MSDKTIARRQEGRIYKFNILIESDFPYDKIYILDFLKFSVQYIQPPLILKYWNIFSFIHDGILYLKVRQIKAQIQLKPLLVAQRNLHDIRIGVYDSAKSALS